MRPAGSGGVPASAALPLLANARGHCLRRDALPLPARRSERDPCYYSDRLPVKLRLKPTSGSVWSRRPRVGVRRSSTGDVGTDVAIGVFLTEYHHRPFPPRRV